VDELLHAILVVLPCPISKNIDAIIPFVKVAIVLLKQKETLYAVLGRNPQSILNVSPTVVNVLISELKTTLYDLPIYFYNIDLDIIFIQLVFRAKACNYYLLSAA
jgi:hypothetical protein